MCGSSNPAPHASPPAPAAARPALGMYELHYHYSNCNRFGSVAEHGTNFVKGCEQAASSFSRRYQRHLQQPKRVHPRARPQQQAVEAAQQQRGLDLAAGVSR